jgi:hypothetical protein
MKTPFSVFLMAIVYWLFIYLISTVPHMTSNYNVNLLWITVVIPNVIRYAVGSIPQLAVNRLFFMSTTIITMILTFIINRLWGESREAITEYGKDKRKTLKLSALLASLFATGAFITYFTGIDSLIYSEMGWESANQGFTI